MKCNACDYDEVTMAEKEKFILDNPGMFDKSYQWLKENGTMVKPFIELEPLQERREEITGQRGWRDSMTQLYPVFACPRCGTLKIDIGQ